MTQKCNYQAVVGDEDRAAAQTLGRCEFCNRSESDLGKIGQEMQVCGIEHYSDIALGKSIVLTIPLCPECHLDHHLNVHMQSEPCPFVARRSWETLV